MIFYIIKVNKQFKIFILFCLCVHLYIIWAQGPRMPEEDVGSAGTAVSCEHRAPGCQKRMWDPLGQLWATILVLGIESGSSGEGASALNCWLKLHSLNFKNRKRERRKNSCHSKAGIRIQAHCLFLVSGVIYSDIRWLMAIGPTGLEILIIIEAPTCHCPEHQE